MDGVSRRCRGVCRVNVQVSNKAHVLPDTVTIAL
jgi:hypothetical protein